MESKKSFGEYLRLKRTEAGLTQKSFADKLYITESAVSKWERGLSYPDITLIGDICKLMQISEHELLTACEDVEARSEKRLAKRYIALVKKIKIAQYFIYGISLLVCLICNIAAEHKLSWFFIVGAAEMTAASLTLLPVLAEKKRGLITLAGFMLSLTVLLAVCCIYSDGSWFFAAFVSVLLGMSVIFMPYVLSELWLPEPLSKHKTFLCFCADTVLLFILLLTCDLYAGGGLFLRQMCPIAAFCLILPWGMMLIISYTRINKYFKAAGCLGLSGVFYYLVNGVIDMVLGITPYRFGFEYGFINWSQNSVDGKIIMVVSSVLLGLAIAFVIAGVAFKRDKLKT